MEITRLVRSASSRQSRIKQSVDRDGASGLKTLKIFSEDRKIALLSGLQQDRLWREWENV